MREAFFFYVFKNGVNFRKGMRIELTFDSPISTLWDCKYNCCYFFNTDNFSVISLVSKESISFFSALFPPFGT